MNSVSKAIISIILISIVIFICGDAKAVSIEPQLLEKLRAEGVLGQFLEKLQHMRDLGVGQATPLIPAPRNKTALGVNDTVKIRAIVILVEFSDNLEDGGSVDSLEAAHFNEMLFSVNSTATGSMSDFYLENSYGQLLVEGDVYGWYMMPILYSEYVQGQAGFGPVPNARTLAQDAVIAADPDVDYNLYDSNGDNYIDALFIVHAGPGRESTGNNNHIHSHQWNISPAYQTDEGVLARDYTMEPEECLGRPSTVGVFCHEFGHIFGLPDLYDVSDSSEGIGNWSLMSGGSWNGGGKSPAHFDAWCKRELSKLNGLFGRTIDVTTNMTDVVLGGAVYDSIRYRIVLPTITGKEYFLIENRKKEGFDKSLPGHGLIIYHCDDIIDDNNDLGKYDHLHVAVEQADGLFELENHINAGDESDPFPGWTFNTEFTDLTTPNNTSYAYGTNEIAVWNIVENQSDSTITCNLDKTYSRVFCQIQSLQFSDALYGNNDGIFDAGERVQVTFTGKNFWLPAQEVTIQISSPTEGVEFSIDEKHYHSLASGQDFNYVTTPFDFTIHSAITPTNARFDVTVTVNSPDTTQSYLFHKYVGGIEVLIVDGDDDDIPGRTDRKQFYTATLESLLVPYEYWDLQEKGTPGPSEYIYRHIIWFTGDIRTGGQEQVPTSDEVAFLQNYLDQGGNLFLTGQDIAEQLSVTADSTFLRDYLKVHYEGTSGDWDVAGVPGNAVSSGLVLRISGGDGAGNQIALDKVTVLSDAEVPFTYPNYGDAQAGSVYESANGSRVLFLGFGFEGISNSDSAEGYNSREEMMEKVLAFLNGEITLDVDDEFFNWTLPLSFQLNQNYPNPFNPTTVISYFIGLKEAGADFSLDVFNILGRRVITLAEGRATAGKHHVEFNAAELSSGVYFYRLAVGEKSETRKMVLAK